MEHTSHQVPLRVALVVLGLAAVALGHWVARFDGPGQLRALSTLKATEVSVSSEVSARIREVVVVEGQNVQAGAPLVRLNDDLPQLQYRMAEAAERQTLQVQLSKYVLTAPRAGVVLRRSAEPGEVTVPAHRYSCWQISDSLS